MNKEIQDLAWQCLPKEARLGILQLYVEFKAESKDNYIYRPFWVGIIRKIDDIFGHHNLTSDEEPEELLFVERQDIINRYKAILVQQDPKNFGFSDYLQGQKELLESMFAAKCIPDKEPSVQSEPRFKVGDKVVVKNAPHIFRTVTSIEENGLYVLDHVIYDIKESDLEPYTEPETKDNMEEKEIGKEDNFTTKELNLCELLKGCEGEEIYSPTFGVVKVTMANCNCIGVDPWNHNSKSFKPDGRYVDKADAIVSLFPSRALYEKYPLDAYSAWMEWKSERTPKRWYPEFGEKFLCLDLSMNPSSVTSALPKSKWEGELNCFKTEEEAQQAAEAVRRTLEEFHKNHTEL